MTPHAKGIHPMFKLLSTCGLAAALTLSLGCKEGGANTQVNGKTAKVSAHKSCCPTPTSRSGEILADGIKDGIKTDEDSAIAAAKAAYEQKLGEDAPIDADAQDASVSSDSSDSELSIEGDAELVTIDRYQPGKNGQVASTDVDALLEPWDAPSDREQMDLAIPVTNQDGKAFSLSDLAGKPIVASFIFTRCPNPKMCPFITLRMASLQKKAHKLGLTDDVHFLLISYDPEYDTPERLKHYGALRGIEFTNAQMLRAQGKALAKVMTEFQLGVDFNNTGGINNHSMDLFVIDQAGRYTRQYQGLWNDGRVLSDIQRLLTEAAPQKLSVAD